jgi:hypothetical protein
MNIISFRGASEVIGDFAERFLDPDPRSFEPLDETAHKYGKAIGEVACALGAEVRHLEKVIDFLVYNDVPEDDIWALLDDPSTELAALAADAAILEKYSTDGTIIETQVVDEIL